MNYRTTAASEDAAGTGATTDLAAAPTTITLPPQPRP